MKIAFIITSAINFKGITPIEEIQRLQQVIHTVDSIKSRIENSDIFLIDSGNIELSKKQLMFFPKEITILSLGQHPVVNIIQKDADITSQKMIKKYSSKGKSQDEVKNFIKIGYIKSVTEHFAIDTAFQTYDFEKYDLVFKISGRYFLNDSFNIQNFSKSSISVLKLKNEAGVCTRLWSFSGNLFEEIKENWRIVLKTMLDKFKADENTDIEECLYLALLKNKPYTSVNKLGISGIVNNPFGKILSSQ